MHVYAVSAARLNSTPTLRSFFEPSAESVTSWMETPLGKPQMSASVLCVQRCALDQKCSPDVLEICTQPIVRLHATRRSDFNSLTERSFLKSALASCVNPKRDLIEAPQMEFGCQLRR